MNEINILVYGANPKEIHAINRAKTGANLYKAGGVNQIYVGGKNEAEDLAHIIAKENIPDIAIVTLTEAETTFQTVEHYKKRVEMEGILKTCHISQAWHIDRIGVIIDYLLKKHPRGILYAVQDGRDSEAVEQDIRLEKKKMIFEKITVLLPFTGLINAAGYKAMRNIL